MEKSMKLNSKGGIILVITAIIIIMYINESHIRGFLDKLTSEAPKEHLAKVEEAIVKHDVENSLLEIDLAIQSLAIIEQYSDSTANKYIEKAIAELENLKVEINRNDLITKDFKHAYFEAYSSIAYANLRLSEIEFANGSREAAYEHFSNCFNYLVVAMKYVDEPKKNKEQKLLNRVNDILTALNDHQDLNGIDFDDINNEMETLMK